MNPPVVQITEIQPNDPLVLMIEATSSCWDYVSGSIQLLDNCGGLLAQHAIGRQWFSPGWPHDGLTSYSDNVEVKDYSEVKQKYCSLANPTDVRFRIMVTVRFERTGAFYTIYSNEYEYTKTTCP